MNLPDIAEARVDEHAVAGGGKGQKTRRAHVLKAAQTADDIGRNLGHVLHEQIAVVGDAALDFGQRGQGQNGGRDKRGESVGLASYRVKHGVSAVACV